MFARVLAASLAVVLLLPALLRADDAPKGDNGLEGDWEWISAIQDGQPYPTTPMTFYGKVVWTFTSDSVSVRSGDTVNEASTIKVDATKTPKTLDITPQSGTNKGKPSLNIYEVKGDALRICTAGPGKDRPTEFSSKRGSGWILIVLKRVKK